MLYKMLLPLIIFTLLFGCLGDPTPEDLGIKLVISSDKLFYEPGEPITISFANMGNAETRIYEILAKEGNEISYHKAPVFFFEVEMEDGTWTPAFPYEVNYGSKFPYHMRSGETMSWTSKLITQRYPGRKIRFVINYKDAAMNEHEFRVESAVVEIAPAKH